MGFVAFLFLNWVLAKVIATGFQDNNYCIHFWGIPATYLLSRKYASLCSVLTLTFCNCEFELPHSDSNLA